MTPHLTVRGIQLACVVVGGIAYGISSRDLWDGIAATCFLYILAGI
jgi:hypothetical protein